MCKTNIGDIESKLKQRGYHIRVRYYHEGNSDPASRTWKLNSGKFVVSKYVTQAVIYRGDQVVGVGSTSCAPNDNPNRKIGRHRAITKAASTADLLH